MDGKRGAHQGAKFGVIARACVMMLAATTWLLAFVAAPPPLRLQPARAAIGVGPPAPLMSWGDAPAVADPSFGFNACPDAKSARARFRALSKEYHPDAPGGNVETFQRVAQAYEKRLRSTSNSFAIDGELEEALSELAIVLTELAKRALTKAVGSELFDQVESTVRSFMQPLLQPGKDPKNNVFRRVASGFGWGAGAAWKAGKRMSSERFRKGSN